jgi:hypothetical protein
MLKINSNRIFYNLILLLLVFLCCNNPHYPKKFKNIPTGTKFFYGPNGNFYILPEEQIDSNSYRVRVYIDSTGALKLEGIFKYAENLYYPSYSMKLSEKILYFNDTNKIYIMGLYQDTLILLLDETLIKENP